MDTRHTFSGTSFNGKTSIYRKKIRQPTLQSTGTKKYSFPILREQFTADELLESIGLAQEKGDDQTTNNNKKGQNMQLWVDKYRPSRYTDLIGDELSHRSLMKWIKSWDFCVYGRSSSNTIKRDVKDAKDTKDSRDINDPVDPLQRPKKKILLLTGSPGSGKTTLAHLSASIAQYNVMEINASDERSKGVVQNKIRNILQMSNISEKPSMIVIDEVDGAHNSASSGFVSTLVNLLKLDEIAVKRALSKNFNTSKKKKGPTDPIFLRPIVCICNDLYAPALKGLRPYAEILHFTPPSQAELVDRLKYICASENLPLDSRYLSNLVKTNEADARSCINALQYSALAIEERGELAEVSLRKECERNQSKLLSMIFRTKKLEKVKVAREDPAFFNEFASMIRASGDLDKLLMACFQAYPSQQYYENQMSKTLAASEWLHLHDTCASNSFEFGGDLDWYSSCAAYKFMTLFSSLSDSGIERSQADWLHFEKKRTNLDQLRCFTASNTADFHQHWNLDSVTTNMIPYMSHLINPYQTINQKHLSCKDHVNIQRAAKMFNKYNITIELHQVYKEQSFSIVPAISSFFTFMHAQSKSNTLPTNDLTWCKLMHSELQRKPLIQHNGTQSSNSANIKNGMKRQTTTVLESEKQKVLIRDYFGLPRPTESTVCTALKEKLVVPKVWVKFNEGYSNAVRLPVKTLAEILV